ncbi:small integral membrane protein 20 isoform X2 [Canis lupus familiaris]|uniref:small integral membrane protein 20 isoform X2 n=1 Tax=Canis lupus familiaris TaxID=9615 RepID=UPI0018F7E25D|nr:small integral membrane protein 20 isoform X2 [Canis lupus familiaris]
MSPNLRTALIFGGFISLLGAAFYPIYFRPLLLPEEYPAGPPPAHAQPVSGQRAPGNTVFLCCGVVDVKATSHTRKSKL